MEYFKEERCFEWCTSLPTSSSESPHFMVKGNEYILRMVYKRVSDIDWHYVLSLELKKNGAGLKLYRIRYEVGYENENNSVLGAGVIYNVSEHNEIWRTSWANMRQQKRIKCKLFFDSTLEPVLKNIVHTEGQQEVTVGCYVHHLEALSRDLSKLLDENSSCDVKITCEGETFHAHRIILGKRSSVFSAMLESSMVEAKTGLIKVEDFGASIFQSFLRYLYSGVLPELSVDTAKQFYEIGDKYTVEEMKKSCSEFLINNLSESTACEILVLADQHSDEDFRKNVVSYIVDKRIPEHDSHWTDFCKNYPILAIEVLNLCVQKNRLK